MQRACVPFAFAGTRPELARRRLVARVAFDLVVKIGSNSALRVHATFAQRLGRQSGGLPLGSDLAPHMIPTSLWPFHATCKYDIQIQSVLIFPTICFLYTHSTD